MTDKDVNADSLLDCKGLLCPQPVIRLKRHIGRMQSGQTVLVVCTDELSMVDVPHFVASAKHDLLSKSAGQGEFHFLVRKR